MLFLCPTFEAKDLVFFVSVSTLLLLLVGVTKVSVVDDATAWKLCVIEHHEIQTLLCGDKERVLSWKDTQELTINTEQFDSLGCDVVVFGVFCMKGCGRDWVRHVAPNVLTKRKVEACWGGRLSRHVGIYPW